MPLLFPAAPLSFSFSRARKSALSVSSKKTDIGRTLAKAVIKSMFCKNIIGITGLASQRGQLSLGRTIVMVLIVLLFSLPSSQLSAQDSGSAIPQEIEVGVQGESIPPTDSNSIEASSNVQESDIIESEAKTHVEGATAEEAETAAAPEAAEAEETSADNLAEQEEGLAVEEGVESSSETVLSTPPEADLENNAQIEAEKVFKDEDASSDTASGDAPEAEAKTSDVLSKSSDTADASETPDPSKGRRDVYCLQLIREDYGGNEFRFPTRLHVDSKTGEIYATDSGNRRILIYTHDFFPLISIGKNDGVFSPAGVAVDEDGYVYVAQTKSKQESRTRISIFNPALIWERDIFFEGFPGADDFSPGSVAVTPSGLIYVTGRGYRGLIVMDKEGNFLRVLSPLDHLGKMKPQKAKIKDITLDSKGRLYLLSEEMSRVYVYDPDEKFLFKFGEKGGGHGKLSRPRGVTLDEATGRIFVIDYMRHSGCAYSMEDGSFLFEFGGLGWSEGWFLYPNDIEVDNFGNLIVSDTFNNRVQVLNIE